MKRLTIVGAGLVGSYLAGAFQKRGVKVRVIEKRSDPRKFSADRGRSINLVLTSRGMAALEQEGLLQKALDLSVPVYGRMVHNKTSKPEFSPYGVSEFQCNFSISRIELNKMLIEDAESSGVEIEFDQELRSIKELSVDEEALIACDGAGSVVRSSLGQINVRKEPLGVSYKELRIGATQTAEYKLDPKSLHIWPSKKETQPLMVMALANQDPSFTVTAFWPTEAFEDCSNPENCVAFFEEHFPTLLPLLEDFPRSFFENPTSSLATLRVDPWNLENKLLLGDSAHAIVPFFGQGMNLGLEGAKKLIALWDQNNAQEASELFKKLFQEQKSNADSIANLAIDQYLDMSERSASEEFQKLKALDEWLEKSFPRDYIGRYGLVTFTLEDYSKIEELRKLQLEVLRRLAEEGGKDLEKARRLINQKLRPFYEAQRLGLELFNDQVLPAYSFERRGEN